MAVKRGFDISLIDAIIRDLIDEIPLQGKHKDHALIGNFKGYRLCHIKPDWLLLYQIRNGVIVFERTGSHSDIY